VSKNGGETNVRVGAYDAQEDTLRDGLEMTYRQLAGIETDEQRRYDLVDKANAVRRWTLR
jgi:serine/threonine-protein kinase PknG